jgi:hypothetical protein
MGLLHKNMKKLILYGQTKNLLILKWTDFVFEFWNKCSYITGKYGEKFGIQYQQV